jgi:hypothetical protein
MKGLRWFELVLFAALFPASATAQQAGDCERVAPAQGPIHLTGVFTIERPERFYCVHAQRGQRMTVRIKQNSNLDLVCNVRFPGGSPEPGGPGGTCFDEQLPDDGDYQIRVAQKFEKKTGQFELTIEFK